MGTITNTEEKTKLINDFCESLKEQMLDGNLTGKEVIVTEIPHSYYGDYNGFMVTRKPAGKIFTITIKP